MRDIAKFGESATIEQMQQASGKRNNEIQPTVSALIQKGLVYRPERARIVFNRANVRSIPVANAELIVPRGYQVLSTRAR